MTASTQALRAQIEKLPRYLRTQTNDDGILVKLVETVDLQDVTATIDLLGGEHDEEMMPHAFTSRTRYEPGDDRDIWCKDCEYHRDHQIHSNQPATIPASGAETREREAIDLVTRLSEALSPPKPP